MQISQNKVALLSYTLTLQDGSIADEADAQHPLAYIQGLGMLLPAFEANLEGKKQGDKFKFSLAAGDAYGEYYDENVAEFPIDMFKQAGFPNEAIEVGAYVPLQDEQGHALDGQIVEISGNIVVVDFNHPLAGQTLNFEGEVIQVREATKEELEHGHVHGPGGHHHQ
jgi:FKBP-type peptidyl-prolyl cis-trans isomerase SlyD